MKLASLPKEMLLTIVNLVVDLVYMIINIFRPSTNQLRRDG